MPSVEETSVLRSSFSAAPSFARRCGEQCRKIQPKPAGNLFERSKSRVLFDPKLVQLIQLVADAARFRGLLLRPLPALAQFAQCFSESHSRRVFHSYELKVSA